MEVQWADSAFRHGVPRAQVLYAMSHADGEDVLDGLPGETTRVFVGPANEVDDIHVEVIVAHRPGRYVRVFHANYLTEKFRYVIEEE